MARARALQGTTTVANASYVWARTSSCLKVSHLVGNDPYVPSLETRLTTLKERLPGWGSAPPDALAEAETGTALKEGAEEWRIDAAIGDVVDEGSLILEEPVK